MDDPQYERYAISPGLTPGLEMVGWSRQSASRRGFSAHAHHDCLEICLINKGSVDWWTADQTYVVNDRNVYISYPGETHGTVGTVLQPCELYWFQLQWSASQPPDFLDAKQAALLHRQLMNLPSRVFRVGDRVVELFDELVAVHREPRELSPLICRGVLLQLLSLIAEQGHHGTRHVSPRVAEAMQWMHRHADRDYSLEELGAAVGLSVSRLQTRFRDEAGCALGEYRTRVKVSLARRLLTTTDLPVTEIAMQLGFSTSQYFATVFRKHHGLSPRQYRKRSSITPAA